MQRFRRVSLTVSIAVTICTLLAGCITGNPTYFPYLFPGGKSEHAYAKPAGGGYYADFDPHSRKLVVRPEQTTIPIKGTQVVIATIYDENGKPRRSRRVEWMLEGPGTIIEVDESGYLGDRGAKIDNKFGYSYTDYFEHTVTRGNRDPNDDFLIGPGQTWCIVSSAVPGETNLIVYAPGIADWEQNKQFVKLNFVDAKLQFPNAVSARAGGEHTFVTKVDRVTENTNPKDFKVRYRIIDGPPAALSTGYATPVDNVLEATTVPGADGTARIRINQPLAKTGTNRVAIEVIKPNLDQPEKFTLVSRSETQITWQNPELAVKVDAPKFVGINQEVMVTYALASKGGIDTQAMTLNATIPEGMELVKTEPRATQDNELLIWTLPALAAGKQQTVQATYRATRLGNASVLANVRTIDGISTSSRSIVEVSEGKLSLKMEGPTAGVVGEVLPYRLTLTNEGSGPIEKVMVRARVEEGLETGPNTDTLNEAFDYLAAGATKTIQLPITAKKTGQFEIQAGAIGDGNMRAEPQSAKVQIQEALLTVTAHGLTQAYVGQEASWELVARNQGDVTMNNVIVRATLPAEISFVSASDQGRQVSRDVVWNLGEMKSRQEKKISLVGLCEQRIEKATLAVVINGDAAANRDGKATAVAFVKPPKNAKPTLSSMQILGIPNLQISLKDSVDPVSVGQKTTYTVRVKNAGTQEATKVNVRMDVPIQLRGIRASGAGATGRIDGQTITFPVVETLAPGAEATYTIETEGQTPGDARFRVEAVSTSVKQPVRAEEPTRVLNRESRPYNR